MASQPPRLLRNSSSDLIMSITKRFADLPRMNLICFGAPIIALLAIATAIMLAPDFSWSLNALSDLGHYTRVDIGPNPLLRALIFNIGLVLTGLLMLYYMWSLYQRFTDQSTRFGILPFGIACIFLIAIGIFSENFSPIHFYVSVGFFFSFPWAMWIIGLIWLRQKKLQWVAIVSIILPFISIYLWWGTSADSFAWSGVAIPEILTAFTAIGWVWVVNLFDITGKLSDLMQ